MLFRECQEINIYNLKPYKANLFYSALLISTHLIELHGLNRNFEPTKIQSLCLHEGTIIYDYDPTEKAGLCISVILIIDIKSVHFGHVHS